MKRITSLMALLILILASALHLHAQAAAPDITGNWQGTLQVGQGTRSVIKISREDGKLKATMYNADQGGQPIPLTTISLQGTTFSFTINSVEATYTGTLNPDGKTISGNAILNGQPHALNLEHVTPENTWPIPEPPKPMAADAKPKFDVVTVKPSDPNKPGKLFTIRGRHVVTINTNMNDLVSLAYGIQVKQLINAPDWFGTEKFDIDGVPDVEGQPNGEQFKMLFQSVLTDRFKLTFHHDQRELSVYVLTVGKGGPKLTESTSPASNPGAFFFRGLGDLTVANFTMKDFCGGMQGSVMDKPVVDHTGLTGRYDFKLKWTPDESQFSAFGAHIQPPATEDPNAPPSLYTAIQEQLGLKLDAARAPADVLVIDHVERPSAN